jgi:hypothetical protein
MIGGATKTRACLIALVAVILAVTGSVTATAARAEEAPAEVVSDSPSLLDEIAWALGFEDSSSPGFWEAFQKARAEEAEALEAERLAANETIIRDALTFGRRIESGERFVEIVPGPSGDVWGGDFFVRIGYVNTDLSTGVTHVTTNYFGPGSVTPAATVDSEIRDGVEIVTSVRGKTDIKVGDSRPAPAPSESAAGLKPKTIDPKSDGSMGRAAGGGPVEPAPPGPTRTQFESLTLPNGRVMTPWFEVNPKTPDLPFASGVDLTDSNWGDAVAQIAALSGKDGKAKGVVGWVSEKGLDTLVAVHELEEGALGDLKPGMTRPTPQPGEPKTWAPAPSGSTSGGQSPGEDDVTEDPGKGLAPGGDEPDTSEPEKDSDGDGSAPADPAKTETEQPGFDWNARVTETAEDGTKYTAYWVTNPDGSHDAAMETERPDGSKSCVVTKDGQEQSTECSGGMTDEPTCRTDCERLSALALLFCTGCDTGYNPLENPGNEPSKGPRPDWQGEGAAYTGPVSIPYWAWSNPDKALAPKNYGDPTDPNYNDPVPVVEPLFEGDVDPVPPDMLLDAASETIASAMRNSLYDPPDPQTTDEAPAGSPPNPGDAEYPDPDGP